HTVSGRTGDQRPAQSRELVRLRVGLEPVGRRRPRVVGHRLRRPRRHGHRRRPRMNADVDFDGRRAVRWVPVVVMLAVLALLPLEAWLRAVRPEVTVRNASPDMMSITWAGRVTPEGALLVAVTYTLADDRERVLDVRVPANSAYVE